MEDACLSYIGYTNATVRFNVGQPIYYLIKSNNFKAHIKINYEQYY
jgi:hypothetical protein